MLCISKQTCVAYIYLAEWFCIEQDCILVIAKNACASNPGQKFNMTKNQAEEATYRQIDLQNGDRSIKSVLQWIEML